MAEGRAGHLLVSGLILLVAGLLYANSLHASFHFDDFRIIVDNPAFKFSHLSWSVFVDVMASARSRALTMATFALNYAVGGEDVFGYHVINILLHGFTGIALYVLLYMTLTATPGGRIGMGTAISPHQIAFWASLLWVAHPIQTQAVTYIVQRATSLAALFFLLTMLCYLKGRLSEGCIRLRWYLVGLLMAGLALGSKETAVTLPLALWLYEVCFFTSGDRLWLKSNRLTLWVALGVTGIIAITFVYGAYGGLQSLIDNFRGQSDPFQEYSFGQRLLSKGRVVVLYLSLLLVPSPGRLNIDHHLLPSTSLWSPVSTFPSWLFVSVFFLLIISLITRQRFVAYWLLWFFLNIALESSLLSNELVFEHRLYLPSMGMCVGLVIGVVTAATWIFQGSSTVWRRTLPVSVVLLPVLVGYGMWTIERNRVWENEVTLWSDAVKKSPAKSRPHLNLALAHELNGRLELAIDENMLAKQLAPFSFRPYYSLGWVYFQQEEWGLASHEISQALALAPSDHFEALFHRLLGRIYEEQGRHTEAVDQWELAYQFEPGLSGVAELLGQAYSEKKEWPKARLFLQEAVRQHPEDKRLRYLLGVTLEHVGRRAEARAQYRKVLEFGEEGSGGIARKSRRRLESLSALDQK